MLTRRDFGALAATVLVNCGGTPAPQSADEPVGEGDVLSRSIVFDAHCDTPGRMLTDGIKLGEHKSYHQVDITRMREGGITAAFFAVFASARSNTPLESVKKGLEISDLIVQEVLRYPDDLVFATTSDEILQAKRDGKIAILLSLEGGSHDRLEPRSVARISTPRRALIRSDPQLAHAVGEFRGGAQAGRTA